MVWASLLSFKKVGDTGICILTILCSKDNQRKCTIIYKSSDIFGCFCLTWSDQETNLTKGLKKELKTALVVLQEEKDKALQRATRVANHSLAVTLSTGGRRLLTLILTYINNIPEA